MKEFFAVLLNVVAVEQPIARHHHRSQPLLTLIQGEEPQVFAFAPQQIERTEARLPTPEKQVRELGLTMLVKANNLAVENC
jgi:hypothetical protein